MLYPRRNTRINIPIVNVFELVQVYVSIQSSGKPIEHFLVDDQFEFRHFILYLLYICKLHCIDITSLGHALIERDVTSLPRLFPFLMPSGTNTN